MRTCVGYGRPARYPQQFKRVSTGKGADSGPCRCQLWMESCHSWIDRLMVSMLLKLSLNLHFKCFLVLKIHQYGTEE